MKITAIETWHTRIPMDIGANPIPFLGIDWQGLDTLWVKIVTADGIVGWGEAFGHTCCTTTRTAIDTQIAPLVLGQDARDIRGIRDRLSKQLLVFGRNGPHVYGLSGIDIALWDIAGKASGLPLAQLLGAVTPKTRPAYASLGRYPNAAALSAACERAVSQGYGSIKLHEVDIPQIQAARSACGPTIPLMSDVNCHWTVSEAIDAAHRLRHVDLAWLEEPVWPPEDTSGLARVRREGGVPIAVGENASGLFDFKAKFEANAIDIAQPSVIKVGGVTAMMEIAALAAASSVRLVPHCAYFGPGWLASLHLNAALCPTSPVERKYCDLQASPYHELVETPDGHATLPVGPGLGRDPDIEVMMRYAVSAPTLLKL